MALVQVSKQILITNPSFSGVYFYNSGVRALHHLHESIEECSFIILVKVQKLQLN